MKILRLDLQAFGPFTGAALDLARGEHGLHLIFEPNEGGKSSTLRALRQVFYGIPATSSDDFIHSYPNLRIGAAIRGGDGSELEFLRRKGNKNTLRLPDDKTPLDESLLARYLGGVDQALFETMFGIDHETLVKGGRAIIQGDGDIGQILFAAGSGVADLRAVQKSLEAEIEALFKPGGSKPAINKALSDLERARKDIRDHQLPSSEWVAHDKSLKQASQRLQEIEERLRSQQHERARLERIQQALPSIAEREELQARLKELGAVAVLSENFSKWRMESVANLTAAEQTAARARQDLDELDRQIGPLQVPALLLEEAESIEQLREELGSYRKAQKDLPGLLVRRGQVDADARQILRELRPDLSIEQAEQLRLTKKQQVEIQNLGNRQASMVQAQQQAETEAAELTAQLQGAEEQLAALAAPQDAGELQAALKRAQSQGDLEGQLAAARRELQQAENDAAIGIKKLSLWTGTLDELEELSLPAAETVDRFEAELSAWEQKSKLFEERLRAAQSEADEVERQIEQSRLQGEVPTEDDLVQARRRRDEGWRLVRQAWKQSPPAPEALRAYLEQFNNGADDLADAYARSVAEADELADRLRREADRVASRAQLEAHRHKCRLQREAIQKEHEQAELRRSELARDWTSLWESSGIKPLSPREMRGWMQRQRALVQTAEAIRKQRGRLAELTERTDATRRELCRTLELLGEPAAAAGVSLTALLDRGAATVDRLKAAADARQQLQKEIARLQKKLGETRKKADESNAALSAWLLQWKAAMTPMGLPEQALPAQANDVMAQISELLSKLKESRDLGERIDGINRDAQQFTQRVRSLAERISPDLAAVALEAAAEGLLDRLRKARTDQEKRNSLLKQRRIEEARLHEACETIDAMQGRLKALCQEAGCETPAELPEIESRSAQARQLTETLQTVDKGLLQLGGGASLADFVQEARAVDRDALPSQIAQLHGQIEQLTAEKERLLEAKGGEEQLLNQMDGSPRAAEAAEEAQTLLAQIEAGVAEYVRLQLASAVLHGGIERYRQQNQGPVVQRASELFAHLTRGSFDGLDVGVNDKDELTLFGLRMRAGTKQQVAVAGMSEGTADQLYLALRLASLETYLEKKEPLPFIVDDILVNFDDDRALATLQEFARLSARTQVIFFTHHRHLVELARQHLDQDVLFTHRLQAS